MPRKNNPTVSFAEAGRRLKVNPRQLRSESKRFKGAGGFPLECDGKLNIERLKVWRAANIKPRFRSPRKASKIEAVAATPTEAVQSDVAAISDARRVLMEGADGAGVATAAMQLAAARLAEADRDGTIGPVHFQSLNNALAELRKSEADYIELARLRGELIERESVRAIMCECAGRLVRCCGILENSIAAEFAVWLADPKVREMRSDERSRMVRAFVTKTCREMRITEADEIDRLVTAAAAEAGEA